MTKRLNKLKQRNLGNVSQALRETSQTVTEVDMKNRRVVEEGMTVIAEAPATEIIEEMATPIIVIAEDIAAKNTKIEHQNTVDMIVEKIMDQDPDHQLIAEATAMLRALLIKQDQEENLLDEKTIGKEAQNVNVIDLWRKIRPEMIGAILQLVDQYRTEAEVTIMILGMEEDH